MKNKFGIKLIKKHQKGSRIVNGQQQIQLPNGTWINYSAPIEKPLDNGPDKFLFGMLMGSKAPTGIAQFAGRGIRWVKNNLPYWNGERKVSNGQERFNFEKPAKFKNQKAGNLEKFIDMINPFM